MATMMTPLMSLQSHGTQASCLCYDTSSGPCPPAAADHLLLHQHQLLHGMMPCRIACASQLFTNTQNLFTLAHVHPHRNQAGCRVIFLYTYAVLLLPIIACSQACHGVWVEFSHQIKQSSDGPGWHHPACMAMTPAIQMRQRVEPLASPACKYHCMGIKQLQLLPSHMHGCNPWK